jgi:hypothetical protein
MQIIIEYTPGKLILIPFTPEELKFLGPFECLSASLGIKYTAVFLQVLRWRIVTKFE